MRNNNVRSQFAKIVLEKVSSENIMLIKIAARRELSNMPIKQEKARANQDIRSQVPSLDLAHR